MYHTHMNRTIRMTTAEFELLQSAKEDIKISGFFSKNFDDKDIVNLIIHYFSAQKKSKKERILNKGKKFLDANNDAAKSPFYRAMVNLGIFDFLNEKPENKVMILDEASENEIKALRKEDPEASLSTHIKRIIFGVVTNAYDVANMMVGYLFSQAFLFISYENRMHKYSFEQAKKDYIAWDVIPKIEIRASELDNYYSVLQKIKEFDSFDVVLRYAKMQAMDEEEIVKSLSNGLLALSGSHYKAGIPPSIKPMNALSAKIYSLALPSMIARKIISITLIYASMKSITSPLSSFSLVDSITGIIFLDNNGATPSNIAHISEEFEGIIEHISYWNEKWEKYVKQFENQD